jgi:phosphoserine/homoserine phosphotransferase
MDMRIDLVRSIGLTFPEIQNLVDKMEPFEGARDFIDWVRDNFQLTIVSDSFYELAWPLLRKLGTPSINCHYLNIEGSELKGYTLRQLENKKKVIKSLKDMKFKVFASGDSYNDIQMLQEADLGVFFQAPKHIREEFQEIGGVESHQELKELLISNSSFVGR